MLFARLPFLVNSLVNFVFPLCLSRSASRSRSRGLGFRRRARLHEVEETFTLLRLVSPVDSGFFLPCLPTDIFGEPPSFQSLWLVWARRRLSRLSERSLPEIDSLNDDDDLWAQFDRVQVSCSCFLCYVF